MKKIVKTKIDKDGKIKSVKFEGNSSFTDLETAIGMAENGQIINTHVVNSKKGKKYLRSNPDDKTGNNLKEITE